MLGEQIHKDLFDKIIDYTKEFTKTLEEVDLSLFEDASAKKKSTHLSSRSKSKPPPKNNKQPEFNMKNAHKAHLINDFHLTKINIFCLKFYFF